MLGYFGKNVITTAPTPGPAPQEPGGVPVAAVIPPKPVAAPTQAPAPIVTPAPAPAAPESGEDPEIAAKLAALRAAVEAKKAQKEAEVRNIQETQRKQAAYGRDEEQIRPPKAGYATEAEKLMGGQTGYGKPAASLQGLGSAIEQVSDMTNEITRLTAVVKQLTKDVQSGVVPRSELEKAIRDLQTKSAEAKLVSSQLSGWTESPCYSKLFVAGGLLVVAYLIYRRWQ